MLTNIKTQLKKIFFLRVLIVKTKLFFSTIKPNEIFIIKNCPAKSVGIDVGSNLGQWSYYMSRYFEQVVAFEPVKLMYKINKICNKNNNYTLVNSALGNNTSKCKIFIPQLNEAEASITNRASKNYEIINQIKGDEYFKNYTNISFIKIDVEGYENDVVRGLIKTIKKHKPLLIIEVEKRHNSEFMCIFDMLLALGYQTYITTEKNNLNLIQYSKVKEFIKLNQNTNDLYSKKYKNNFVFIYQKKNQNINL